MTQQRELKALVRERMAKTGERYSAARARIIAKHAPSTVHRIPGLLDGYTRFGGIQAATGPVANALAHAGIRSSLSNRPFSEIDINGICGGPGFLYAVFEYKGWPPILSLALQSRSMPDVYVAAGLSRLGVRTTVHETTSKAVAQKALDEALAAGKAPLCVVDVASLPWYTLPPGFVGGGPHVVAIAGRDGDRYWIDDRASRPLALDGGTLASARAAYRQARNRLIVIEGLEPSASPKEAMSRAIADTALRYVEPAVPKSFWANCGWSGLEKWRAMLTDPKDKKGWPTVFGDGPRAYAGLQRAYECIECQLAPGAGRGLYADFLDQAASVLDRPRLSHAARSFRQAGEAWTEIATVIAKSQDKALREACSIDDRRLALEDSSADSPDAGSAELSARRRALGGECRLTKADACAIYAQIATLVANVIDAERAAVAAMET